MNTTPLISIITPTYNRAKYLPEAIESVLSQDYQNFEFLIIDDGSNDNSKEIIDSFNSKKIRYFFQENSGQNVARNRGIAEAKGDFICFLDSDNRWLPGKLRRSIKAIQTDPSYDIVYADGNLINEKGEVIPHKRMPRYSGKITNQLIKDNCVSMNTTLVKTEKIRAIGGFSSHVKVADDYDLWLRLSANCKFLYLPELFADYRVMENQISSDKKRRFSSNEEIIQRFLAENPNILKHSEKQDALNFFYTRAARHFSGTRDFKLAYHYFGKAFGTKLFGKRTWRAFLRHIKNLV